MTHSAKILADSVSPDGVRLTTFEITFPRIVLSEFNTHRVFSRNSASSRAIPVEKMIRMVEENPYIPNAAWPKNQKGMSASENLEGAAAESATMFWLLARDDAVYRAKQLLGVNVHKQITNRLLEPFLWHTVIVTATEWSNFFHLRDNPQAHPDIQKIAHMMRELYESPDRKPRSLDYGEWHLPLVGRDDNKDFGHYGLMVDDPEAVMGFWCKVSVGRCARVSYLTHDGKRDPQADIELHDRLLASGHMSPFEHVARPMTSDDWKRGKDITMAPISVLSVREAFSGNFRGWVQLRKTIPNEQDILADAVASSEG